MMTNKEIRAEMELIHRRLDLIDRTLVVSNPESPRAAETFDGLRKAVLRGASAAQLLEASLAQLDETARATDDVDLIRAKIRELLAISGVERTTNAEGYALAFEISGEGTDPVVTKAAYVSGNGSNIVVHGVVELQGPAEPAAEAAAVEGVETGSPTENVDSEAGNPDASHDLEGASE